MKPANFILASIIITAVAACSKSSTSSTSSNRTFSLNMETDIVLGECQTSTGNEVKICYDKLVEDSRCPKGAYCVWAGIGVGEFSFYVNNQKHVLTLATYNLHSWRKDTVVAGYKVELLDLFPHPDVNAQPGTRSARVKINDN